MLSRASWIHREAFGQHKHNNLVRLWASLYARTSLSTAPKQGVNINCRVSDRNQKVAFLEREVYVTRRWISTSHEKPLQGVSVHENERTTGFRGSGLGPTVLEPIRGEDGIQASGTPPSLDFTKWETLFQKKSTSDLVRSFVVLQMCSFNFFVDNSLKLMSLGQRLLGETIFAALMRATFYSQFAASPESVRQVAQMFNEAAITPMLATTAEEEVGDDPNHIVEDKYERNVATMLLCLDMQSEVVPSDRPTLSQVKLTSYIKADVLAKLSDVLKKLRWNFLTDGPVSVANFRSGLDGAMETIPELTEVEMAHLKNALTRLDTIVQSAGKHGIRILVDAEFCSINPAMSLITFALMKKYNLEKPMVWNTYQCYLKSAMASLEKGLAVADAEGFAFGVKVVRGAYMEHEAAACKATGRSNPVNETYEATNEMYDRVVARLMGLVQQRGGDNMNMIVASHNMDSVQKAIKRMWELDLPPREGSVVFGQLMGMCDHVSYGLGQAGYLTYKSVPFGSVADVLANISRRAVENKTVFHRLQHEKLMLKQTIAHRTRLSSS